MTAIGDSTMNMLMPSVAATVAWWNAWRGQIAEDQVKRRRMKTIEDRVEGLELVKRFCLHDHIAGTYTLHKLYRDPYTGVTLLVAKEYKL